jgi:hypothetical protein
LTRAGRKLFSSQGAVFLSLKGDFDMADAAAPKKKAKYSIPSSNARSALDKVFMDHDTSSLNAREKVQAARDAARVLANEVDRLRSKR